jgi:hypothetical protein
MHFGKDLHSFYYRDLQILSLPIEGLNFQSKKVDIYAIINQNSIPCLLHELDLSS